jgi:hypothetical protein
MTRYMSPPEDDVPEEEKPMIPGEGEDEIFATADE